MQSLLYLCIVISGCAKHNMKLQDKDIEDFAIFSDINVFLLKEYQKKIIWKLIISGEHCEKYNKISYHFWQKRALVYLYLNFTEKTIFIPRFFKNISLTLFKIFQGVNSMCLSTSLVDCKTIKYFTNLKMSPTFLRCDKIFP